MDEELHELLDQLLDEGQPLPVEKLYELSDLTAERIPLVCQALERLPDVRRLNLLSELGRQADEHIELNFERINRLAIQDSNAEVRCMAIRNLWECEDPLLVSPLLQVLEQDPSDVVRAQSATALGAFVQLGELDKMSSQLLRKVEQGLLYAWEHDHKEKVRRNSMESLGYSSREEVPDIIRKAYHSDEEEMMRSALLAMGRSANSIWESHVLEQLNHPGPEIRSVSARAAGELELTQATETLIELLDDVNDQVQCAAAWALGQLGGNKAADALSALLDTTDDPEMIQILEDALDHLQFVDGMHDFLMIDFEEPEDPSL
jgi:HEAT repeat protein